MRVLAFMKKTLIFFIVPYLFWGQEFQSNLPIVVINTNGKVIVDNPRIVCDMGVIHNPSSINKISDQFNNYNGKISIEIRGSSSQQVFLKSHIVWKHKHLMETTIMCHC